MAITIRAALPEDIEAIANLAEQKRIQYEAYQPVFHRRAEAALAMHREYLKSLIHKENVLLWVALEADTVEGFIFASVVASPVVYNPGGKVCFVDDFVISKAGLWPTMGKALLEAVTTELQKSGVVLGNVVCGPKDTPKRLMLGSMGYSVATEWFVKAL
jgi:hypothetical protein